MTTLGLKVSVINADTADEAQRLRNEDLWVAARAEPTIIIAGPEQLTSDGFKLALRDEEFYNRICGVGFDEIHLLNVWGPYFRKAFEQMGFMKARLHQGHNPWICTSATVQDGEPFQNICHFLGLREGHFHVIRRSNLRPDVQILVRAMKSGINGDTFPELDWVVTSNRLTLVFTKSISLSSRVQGYLLRKAAQVNRKIDIRLYNSANFTSYNDKTREILLNTLPNPAIIPPIIIGTDSLSVGIDMPAAQDVILMGQIDDTDDCFQKIGRVGRRDDLVPDPRGIIYVSPGTLKLAAKLVAGDVPVKRFSRRGTPMMTLAFAKLILKGCKTIIQNVIYSNPLVDPACSTACWTCHHGPQAVARRPRKDCICSDCIPETLPELRRPQKPFNPIPKKHRLTRLMHAHGIKRLTQFRDELAMSAGIATAWMLPPDVFLPAPLMSRILNQYALITSIQVLAEFLKPYSRLRDSHASLLAFIVSLRAEFDAIDAARKAENAAKAKAKRDGEAVDGSDDELNGVKAIKTSKQ